MEKSTGREDFFGREIYYDDIDGVLYVYIDGEKSYDDESELKDEDERSK